MMTFFFGFLLGVVTPFVTLGLYLLFAGEGEEPVYIDAPRRPLETTWRDGREYMRLPDGDLVDVTRFEGQWNGCTLHYDL